MAKNGSKILILKLLSSSHRPLSTREISEKLNLAWHTADRYCLKLQLEKKIDNFTIGKATAWFLRKDPKKAAASK